MEQYDRQASTSRRPDFPGSAQAEKLMLESEKYKTVLAAPKGMVPIDDDIKLLRKFDDDDDFFHVSCHVDQSMKNKIEAGEYVELEKLLPKEHSARLGCSMSKDSEYMQLVNRDGQTYFAPARSLNERINGIKKWDQAFCIYTAIYSEANPSHASEI